jgi:membrane protein implicated in regulation of membrane protease activity
MAVFLSLAGIGLLFLLVSAFAGDHIEVHPEVEVGGGHMGVRAVAVFLTAFGTVGAIAKWYEMGNLASSLWGIAAGVLLSVIYVLTMGLVRSQEADSLIQDAELIGCTGRISVAIAAGSLGEVSCNLKGQTTRRMVRTASGAALAEGTMVRVKEVQGDVLIVEPVP